VAATPAAPPEAGGGGGGGEGVGCWVMTSATTTPYIFTYPHIQKHARTHTPYILPYPHIQKHAHKHKYTYTPAGGARCVGALASERFTLATDHVSVSPLLQHLRYLLFLPPGGFWPFAARYVGGLWCRSERGSDLVYMCHP